MGDHAYSFYCKDKYWERCDDENLEVIKVFCEDYNEDGELTQKEAIYRCRVCGGFYKQQYHATYYPSNLFDTEEGWSITNDYFRINEPRWKTPGSTLDVPLTIDEARKYGYAGEDHSWKNGRCNFPVQNVELTCRAGDLQFVADATPNAWDHLKNKLYKCRRCGEWYLFTPYPQGLFKPSNEIFPLDLARAYGYEENLETESENKPGNETADFDALARSATESGSLEDLNALYGALVALREWVFIARGMPPDLYPYSAPSSAGEMWVRGFTDGERARRFAEENNLLDAGGTCVTLHIPTADVVKHLENHPRRDIRGIWFNHDRRGTGFLVRTEQIRPLIEHFSKPKDDRKQAVTTLQVIIQEALVLSPELVRETPYKINFFCRVPEDWVENGQLKAEFWQRIATRIFGEDWSAEIFPGARYIIKSSETVILKDDSVKERNWSEIVETKDALFYFFTGAENGDARKVTAREFQENVDAHFQNAGDEPLDEPENLFELNDSLAEAWREPEKLPAAGEWLQFGRSEAARAQFAYIVLKKHFAREKLPLRKDKLPGSWWSMGWALYLNIDVFVREQKHSEMLKAMFAELIDFCQAASGEYFAYHLKELLEKLIDDPASRGKIIPLLPAKALEQFAEIDRMRDREYEDYIDRSNQMGY